MSTVPSFAITGLFALTALHAGETAAQNYPSKPVRFVTAAAGAGSDFAARMLAPGLTESWGQPLVIDNRGGSAVIPVELVTRATPDGYTLLVFGSTLWHLPLMQSVPYDAAKDLIAITQVERTPLIVVVHPSLPVKSVKELVAYAKQRPGQLNYASGISGATTHLFPELFKSMAGVDIVRVAYKGGAPALTAILGGETQVMFATATSAGPHAKSGRLRALAVTSAQRTVLYPELPTIAESGLPGYEASSAQCLFAPAGTPAALIRQLHRDAVKVLEKPEVRARFLQAGSEVAGTSPEEIAAYIKADTAKMGKLIREAGIRAN